METYCSRFLRSRSIIVMFMMQNMQPGASYLRIDKHSHGGYTSRSELTASFRETTVFLGIQHPGVLEPPPSCVGWSVRRARLRMKEPLTRPDQSVTQLLVKWGSGDKTALDELIPLVYDELRKLAASYLRRKAGATHPSGHMRWCTKLMSGWPTRRTLRWNIARSSLAWRRR